MRVRRSGLPGVLPLGLCFVRGRSGSGIGVSLPILQLGLTPADQTAQAIACRVTQAVWSESAALAFSREAQRAGGTLKIHIKLDTGMSRLGFPCDGGSFDAPRPQGPVVVGQGVQIDLRPGSSQCAVHRSYPSFLLYGRGKGGVPPAGLRPAG